MSCFEFLPYEILLTILNYVSTSDLWKNLRLTSHFFELILKDDKIWQSRIQKRYNVELPYCQLHSHNFSLVQCCSEIEEEFASWNSKRLADPVDLKCHDATVDAIQLFSTSAYNRLCITGSRDRSVVLWDVNKISKGGDENSCKVLEVLDAHDGWIWNICRTGSDAFYSCGWDCHVKEWRVTNSSIKNVCSTKLSSAVLSVISGDNQIACSTFDRKVYVLDSRTVLATISEMSYHRRPVFGLAQSPSGHYLYSCGEDRLIACIDKRMWRPVHSITLSSYALSLSLESAQLLCGTSDGRMILFDPSDLSIINEFVASPSNGKLLQIKLNVGSQMALGRGRRLKIFTPGLRPILIAESTEFDAEPSRFDYYQGDLAVACGDGSVLFWTRYKRDLN